MGCGWASTEETLTDKHIAAMTAKIDNTMKLRLLTILSLLFWINKLR
jgi:hypothetical protein